MSTSYVCGFPFTEDGRLVLLIEKNRPAWQVGYFDGIGGKIESGETPAVAMDREAREEVGLANIPWQPLARLQGKFGVVYFFSAFTDAVRGFVQREDEVPNMFSSHDLSSLRLIPNLHMLIPLALHRRDRHRFVEIVDPEG